MTIKAYVIIDDGETLAETIPFDVKPEVGEILQWMLAGKGGHAKIIRLEHRQTPDGFCFTVIAETVKEPWVLTRD